MAHSLPQLGPVTPIQRLLSPFVRFTRLETSGGITLLVAALIAMIWANSPWWESYHHLWETRVRAGFGDFTMEMTLHHFINDALMAIFFFLVGLEIKREMLVGELASLRAAALPIAGAIGGMVAPALLYTSLNYGGPGSAGWGVPMATDIAFALGVLALLGPRVPLGLKVFLAALAIADDMGAVIVIAIFYTPDVKVFALVLSAALLATMALMNRAGVRHPAAYAIVGLGLWGAVFASGVHATVAGVLGALTIPARTRVDTMEYLTRGRRLLDDFDDAGIEGESVLTNRGQQDAVHAMEDICEAAQTPLQRLEHALHLPVNFFIIPLFALANAGVHLSGGLGEAFTSPVTLGVILGLVVGKPLGITLASWLAVKAGWAALPAGTDFRGILGVGALGGIGFTMALFIGTLGFGDGSPLLDSAKVGILSASVIAAILGSILVSRMTRSAPAR